MVPNTQPKFKKNTNNILKLSQTYTVLSADAETARLYGIIKAALRKQGTPIPENDIWIAAQSKQYRLTLITRDKHFSHIADLDTESW